MAGKTRRSSEVVEAILSDIQSGKSSAEIRETHGVSSHDLTYYKSKASKRVPGMPIKKPGGRRKVKHNNDKKLFIRQLSESERAEMMESLDKKLEAEKFHTRLTEQRAKPEKPRICIGGKWSYW